MVRGSRQRSGVRGDAPTTIPPVPLDDTRAAFAARGGRGRHRRSSRLRSTGCCEQGHVGLERVAKARRDPALVEPVTAALERARRDLRPAQGRRLGAARVAREPAASGRSGARADRNRDRGRRAGALHLVPPGRARALSRRAAVGFDLDEHRELCRAWCATTDGLVARPGRPRASASAACSGSGPTTTRSATWRRRRWAIRRSCGSRPSTATAPPPTARHRDALLALARAPERGRRVGLVGHRDVDRRAAAAADAHLLRHLYRRPSTSASTLPHCTQT